MSFSFRRFSFSFLLVAVGLFPYMPLAHTEPAVSHPQHHSCESAEQDGHEMDLCIRAVHDILSGTQMDIPVISIVPAFIFPFWEKIPDTFEARITQSFFHSLDPPLSWSIHHLVGIVRILV